ncbi:helix-turn-helix domain-containing protein [Propioniciclava tarda]|uniref:XRE family transcriptional regulator n=1 Tax=Propioniciclava tarda TaxID=433330 RepID=A0A4Q9KN68_PROTD|nr:helix-turn-helix transcriptional regulator [Propioniciclava tarda]TBT95430.1 XRE family transcriptional regulator [Propioniciclava tarda]SMO49365.1 Helix-turn-helix [Propioniciclava tarda]
MSTLEDLLGINASSPSMIRAELLADNDRALLRGLIQVRRARGFSQEAVGAIMGITQPSVASFEAHDSNPTLATIRRYAHAVGALIKHDVEMDEGQLLDDQTRGNWVTTSINDLPVRDVAELSPPSENVVRLRAVGAAGFPVAEPAGPTDFALAA